MEKKVTERNYHLDNMKALLIFLVVLGHVLKKFGTTTEAATLYKIIFSFHMPAFIFVSGYFAKYNPKRVFSKLFPLYLVFQVAQYLETFLLGWITTGHPKPFSIQFFTPQWTLWYLVAMMMFQLFLPVFDTDQKKKQMGFLILALILGLAIGLTPDINNFMAMSRVFVFLPFFLLGYYEKKSHVLMEICRKNYRTVMRIITAVIGVILIVIFSVYGPQISAKIFFGTESFTDWYSVLGRIFAWLVAFVWIVILFTWIPEQKMGYIGTIGSNTLPIYLLHSLVLLLLMKTGLPNLIHGNMIGIIVLSVVITVVLSWKGFETTLRKIQIPIKNYK